MTSSDSAPQEPVSPTEQGGLHDVILALLELVGRCTALARDGHPIDLTALEERATTLCRAATALPPAEARRLLPLLSDFIDRLESLRIILQTKLQTTPPASAPARGPVARQRALRAYGRSGGDGPV